MNNSVNRKMRILKFVFIYLLVFTILTFGIVTLNIRAAAQPVELVVCAPGEDAATQATFSWHGNSGVSHFYITTADDTKFSKAKDYEVRGTQSTTFAKYVASDGTTYENSKEPDLKNYYYDFALDDLIPNTDYIYRVKCSNTYSDTQSFKTCGTSGSFNFLWISDMHVYDGGSTERYTYLEKIYQAYVKDNGAPDLIISSGDDCAYGGSYGSWQTLARNTSVFKKSEYAIATGNHTEYPNGASGVITNAWLEEIMPHPENGVGSKDDSSYFYLYNGILFIALDAMIAHKSNAALKAQRAWFEEVMKKMDGKYQYIIVYQHYPWLNALTGSIDGPYGTNRQVWYDLFDKYEVDLALAGDHHCYYRSKSMIGTEVVEDGVGTTYMGAPQIGGRGREMTNHINDDHFACRYDDGTNYAYFSGATRFSVTPEGISGKLVDLKENVIDEYFIPAKRSVTWESNKDAILNSVVFSVSESKYNVDFNRLYADCIKEVNVYMGDTLLTSVDPNTTSSSIEIDGLEANKTYNLKLEVKFIDNTVKSKEVLSSTYPYFGTVGKVEIKPNNDKINITWKADLKNDVVKEYKLYADNALLDTISATSTSYTFDKSKANLNTVYTLNVMSNKNDIIYSYSFTYNLFGDANFDSLVNEDDVKYLLGELRASYQFSGNEYLVLDLNDDGIIDIGDAQILYARCKNKLSTLNNYTVTVLFLGKNGAILSEQEIEFGGSAKEPTNTGSDFVGWSDSYEGIIRDTVIRAIYN